MPPELIQHMQSGADDKVFEQKQFIPIKRKYVEQMWVRGDIFSMGLLLLEIYLLDEDIHKQ